MSNNKKAAQGLVPLAASKKLPEQDYNIRYCIKAAIIRLALWGLLPLKVAEWLIHQGGLRHD